MGRWLGRILARQPATGPNGWFASPSGSSSNTGGFSDPWDLDTAFAGGNAGQVQPGDNVFLRDGTYTGSHHAITVSGTAGNLITFRSYYGEWAVLDGGSDATSDVISIQSSYVRIQNIEVGSSATDRTAATDDSGASFDSPHTGIQNGQTGTQGTGCKIINCIIKNLGGGISLWTNGTDTEVYGNLIYYHGWTGPTKAWGVGIYSQNIDPSTRIFKDNIIWGNNEYAFQAYSESTLLDNHDVEGNIIFFDGAIRTVGGGGAVTIGGGTSDPTGNVFSGNAVYGQEGHGVVTFERGNESLVCENNLHGYAGTTGGEFNLSTQTGSPTVTGNQVYSGYIAPAGYAASYPANDWYYWSADFGGPDAKPTGAWAMVRPNQYESSMGYVAIFNWDHSSTVSVNVSSFVGPFETYALYHAMDPKGSSVATGNMSGGTNISFPMGSLPVEAPVNAATPASTGTEFAAFIVLKTPS